MPSFVHDLDNATGKRKRDSNGLDERDLDREKEVQMKIAAASQYNNPQAHSIFPAISPFPDRSIISPRQRTPGSKRRYLLSLKESVTFSGSPTHTTNPFSSLRASLDTYTASPARPPTFNLPYTLDSLQENIRIINQDIATHNNRSPYPNTQQAHKPAAGINLDPCHICQRRPRQKQDLDCYADCEGCGRRCCWICVRQCWGTPSADFWSAAIPQKEEAERKEGEDHEMGEGDMETREHKMEGEQNGEDNKWPAQGGHKTMVCSSCCLERGGDGEVRCLGCLKAEEAG